MTMKQLICLGMALLLGAMITTAQGAEPRLIKIGAFNYYPAIFQDTDGQIKGFYVDALADLAERENLRIKYVYGTWNEGLERIKTGEIDILTSVAQTPQRSSYLDFTQIPLLTVWGELYVHPDSHIDTILETDGKKIAVVTDDFNGQFFIELTRKFNINCTFVEVGGFERVFKAIANKQVDGGVVNNTFGAPKQKEYGLRSAGVVFNPFNIYFAVSKGKNQDLLSLLDEYLHDWRHDKDSPYAQARQKWTQASFSAQTFPNWLKHTISVLVMLVVTATCFILLLRRQVHAKTRELLERKTSLRESIEKTGLLLNSTAEGIYGLDRDGNCTMCNAAGLRMLGYQQPEQLLGKNMHELVHHTHQGGSQYANSDCPIVRSFSSGDKIHCNTELFWRADGSSFPVEYWSYPITKDDEIIGAVVTFIDTSERKRTETQLRESEARYRSIFENSRSVMLIIDPESTAIVDANPAAAEYYGWSQEQLCSKSIYDINVLKPEQVAAELRQAAQQYRYYFIFKHRLADGSIRDVELFSSPIHSEGKLLLFTIIHDITQRLEAEEALQENEMRYRTLVEHSPLAVLINHNNRMILTNKACLKLFGADDEAQLLGKSPFELFHHDDHQLVQERIQQLTARPCVVPSMEETIIRLDGRPVEVEVSAASFRFKGDLAIHVVLQDISERKQAEQKHHLLEEQLRHAQRMEAIGGIAHDFNNILTAIIGYAHICQIGLPVDAPQRPLIQQITEAANRATHLTKDLLLFSRKQTASKRIVDLNEILAKTSSFLQRVIGETIQLDITPPPQPVMIDADPHQINQILMNLATNARDAMPDGGTITISIDQQHLDAADAALRGLENGGEYAVISVNDTGSGIPEEYLHKIFDPFFTTKEIGQGTGLGLPIVYGIVAAHQGAIQISSTPGNGTTATLWLPCTQQEQMATKEEPNDEPLPRGTGETILLAEDNERIRDMACQVLTEFGYQVLTAVDGDDALRLFREHQDTIRLLLFDLVMPNKGGYEAYQEIQELKPALAVLFTTGYAPQVAEGKLSQAQMQQLLHKPFAIVQLLKRVRLALDTTAKENQA